LTRFSLLAFWRTAQLSSPERSTQQGWPSSLLPILSFPAITYSVLLEGLLLLLLLLLLSSSYRTFTFFDKATTTSCNSKQNNLQSAVDL
jgi:hypothetical protein